ncbi:MAG: T9SS type A sorting domain-containing protein [Deferribacteres bacterium]|nr:T9SS type A sorting domain-containing protein [Deferribacteres bacterium]
MKFYKLIIALFLWVTLAEAGTYSVYEANYPDVKDYNVNVDSAKLVIIPRGNFIEMNLTMTVSYDFESWFFKNYNELEFLWEFSLPEEAILHDFAIWLDDSLLSATMLDRWTAELLFSDVSSPVRHPGLLTQGWANRDGQVSYALKLFPLKRQEKRRFQIQYLLPARPSVGALRAWLPTTQLISAKSPGIDTLHVVYQYETNASEPLVVGCEVLKKAHVPARSSWEMTLPLEFDQFAEIILPSPVEDSFFFSTYRKNEENYYHLAVYPPTVAKIQQPRNILVLIDFNRYNTDGLDGEFLLSYLKETVQQALSEEDSINVIVAYENLVQGAENWVACSEENIDAMFTKVLQRSFPGYSTFQPIIVKAAQFLKNKQGTAEILLFTNTDEIGLYGSSRDIMADQVIGMFKPGTRLHVIDLENKSNLVYNSDKGYYESQLHSFWGRMTYNTGGNLFFLRYNEIKSILSAFFYEAISHFETVEVQLRFQAGYAHSTHLMALHEGYYPLNFPIMQVGKFTGEFPVDVKIFGKTRENKVVKQFTIEETDVTPGTEAIATSWYGDHIRTLLRYPYDPITVGDIINLSIEQNILSPYSGFIVLDPNNQQAQDNEDPNNPNGDSGDKTDWNNGDPTRDEGGGMTDVENTDGVVLLNISAYPNPFSDHVNILVQKPAETDIEVFVFNVRGQKVCSLEIQPGLPEQTVIWDGHDEEGNLLSSGVYFIVMRGEKINKVIKVMILR